MTQSLAAHPSTTTPDRAPILSVRHLSVAFSADQKSWREVVHSVSFDIHAGETLAIVGESGSGKSVTAMSVMRLLPRQRTRYQGEIHFEGKDLLTLPEEDMLGIRGGGIGMIFQEPMTSLNPSMRIGEQIGEVLRYHLGMKGAEARAEVLRLLARVKIPSPELRIDYYPGQLSGGMRQRVMIAMVLAGRPRLLIADEPTTALDVTVQAEILELIRQLQREDGMAVLFITHDMGVVAQIAHRTMVLYHGNSIEAGPTRQILDAPVQPYTRLLLMSVQHLGSTGTSPDPVRYPSINLETGVVTPPPPTAPTVSPEASALLEVRDLRKVFPVGADGSCLHAVGGVSFELRAGETLAVVGESGCGKSTLGRSLMRLLEPSSGQVLLKGQEITALSARAFTPLRRKLQMIFQDPYASLDPRMTVGKAIAEPVIAHGLASKAEAMARAAALLGQVGLDPAMVSRYPHEFSGGQRQRISIARALVLEPEVIVADECVSALDASVKGQVVNLLMDLQEKLGLAYLFISHDMAVVERISHRVAVMFAGQIVEIGPRAAVFGRPSHPYTEKLLRAVPRIDGQPSEARPGDAAIQMRSPIYAKGALPPVLRYQEVGPQHFVGLPA